jgi:hypothetical protein
VIVLPAVARLEVPYTAWLYAPLVLLHASLATRVVGDLTDLGLLRRLGGIGNALALGCFALTLAISGMTRRTSRRCMR